MAFAVFVGLAFVGAALAGLFLVDGNVEGLPKLFLMLVMATGIALIVVAFGGRGVVKLNSAAFAGATATMFAILAFGNWMLERDQSSKRHSFAAGQISGIDWDRFAPLLKFGDYAPSYLDRTSDEFRFVSFETNMTRAEATLLLSPRDGSETPSIRIPVACFRPYLDGSEEIDWEFDAIRRLILDKRDDRKAIGGEAMADGVAPCRTKINASAAVFSGDPFGLEARAQPLLPLNTAERDKALAELSSDDAEVRRTARDFLASGSPQDVPAFLAYVHAHPVNNYRLKLGVAVALTEMLRRDKGLRDDIAKAMTSADKALLVDFIGQGDRTLRIYATEFLFDLADAEAAGVALQRAAAANDEEALFSWLFSAQDGWARMTADQRAALNPTLAQLRAITRNAPKTAALLDRFK
ncbi:MAG: hypothetical protein IPL47_02085 [Phyllobacteriaceae bacterium]|nr:hypothetical protein [Phyllobacteriaceae bacterium]